MKPEEIEPQGEALVSITMTCKTSCGTCFLCQAKRIRLNTAELQIYFGSPWVLLCMSNNPRRVIIIDYEFGDFSYYADGFSLEFDMEGYEVRESVDFPCVAADGSHATWNETTFERTEEVPKLFEEDRKFLDLTLSLKDMEAYPVRKYGLAHILGDSYTGNK